MDLIAQGYNMIKEGVIDGQKTWVFENKIDSDACFNKANKTKLFTSSAMRF